MFERWFQNRWRWILLRYGVALLTGALAAWLRYALIPIMGTEAPYTLLFASIVVVAVSMGAGPGLLTAAIGIWAGETFLLQSSGSWHLTWASALRISFILAGTLYVGYVGHRLRQSNRKSVADSAALRESEGRLRATFDQAAMGIIEVDEQDRFIAVNNHACEILGYSSEELLHMNANELTHPEDRAVSDEMNSALNTSRLDRIDYEKRYVKRDGTPLWAHVTVSAVRDSQGRIMRAIGTIEDITERKRAEEAFRDAVALAEQRAEELQRSNQDLEQFAYIASHDLQGPLRLISGFADLLKVESAGKLTNQEDYYITVMADSAKNMSRMVGDLLSYSRVGSHDKQPRQIDMEAVLQATLAELGAAIRESGAAVTHDPLVTVWADETQMRQLLANLIGNAIKFRKKTEPSRVHVSVERRDNDWRFSVRDNGIGIDRKFQDRIFAIFQRLHSEEQYPGTGIGLAICKRIVDRHGGKMSIESEPGQGATFYFTIPGRG